MNEQKLIEILLELSNESKQLGLAPSEASLKKLTNKYNMLFFGENFNRINTLELAHSIKIVFNISFDKNELNLLIPVVCEKLHMKYEPLINASDISLPNPPITCYFVTLW